MEARHRIPLGARVGLWHAFLFLGSALALLTMTYVILSNRAYATERDAIEFRLRQYAYEYQGGGLPAVKRLAALRKGRAQQAFFVRLASASNAALFLRESDDWSEFRPSQLDGQPVPEEEGISWQSLHSNKGTELLIATTRLPGGEILQVGKSTEDLADVLAEFRKSAVIVVLIFFPISFLGGAFLTSRLLRPIKHLTEAAREIVATGKFDARVPLPGSRDELDALVQVFNEMLVRIEGLLRNLRETIDNVAHDLRTPLTLLQARAQSALAGTLGSKDHAGNAASLNEALANCVEDSERVSTILNTIMDISEAESGLASSQQCEMDLAPILQDSLEGYSEFAEERGVRIEKKIEAPLSMKGDPASLFRVFANLLDNAIKYTERDGVVRVVARQGKDKIRIQISDTGIGISEEDLPRIWERLFRSDRSRTERGLGLGLNFVRAIVEVHGGTISAESQLGRGTTMIIILPALRAATFPDSNGLR